LGALLGSGNTHYNHPLASRVSIVYLTIVVSLTQCLPIKLPILLPTLNILKFSKIKLVHLIFQPFVELLEWCDVRSRVEIHEDETLACGMSGNFEESVDGFIEVGYGFEARCLDQATFCVVGPAMVFATYKRSEGRLISALPEQTHLEPKSCQTLY
jgi:hypothetical protein